MKKIYKNRLPKDKEVKSTNVRVENDEVVVEVELKDKFEPKFGDIVRVEYPEAHSFRRNYVISIFPNKEVPKKSVDYFFDIATVDMNGYVEIDDSRATYNHNHVYIASPSEKKELFDKLAGVGKRWNEETKQLENIRWRAKKGEAFYFVSNEGNNVMNLRESDGIFSSMRYKSNNYFRTAEAAQKVADQIKEIFKNSKTE